MKLTIIIPHYNSSRLLEKLLATIPKEKNIEVIVIDDKSENMHIEHINSLKHTKEYIDFMFLKNETTGKGAGVARNIGLDHANGKWILFADADDYFTENFYESISEYFESDNEVVFFKPISIYIDTGKVADRHKSFVEILDNYKYDSNSKYELCLRYKLPMPWSKLIKKEFLDKYKIKFDETLVAEDVMFSTRVGFFMKKFNISDKTIYVVTRSYGSLTTNMSENLFDIKFKIVIDYYNFLKRKLLKEEFNELGLSERGRSYLVKSMKYGMRKFFKVLIELFKNNITFFHYKLLNPLYLISKTIQYKKRNKKEEKYAKDENLQFDNNYTTL